MLHRYRTGQRSKRHGRFGALLARQHGVGDALQRAEMRNVRLNFRQQERSHLMENMIYNDLIRRGYSVDVGIVELTRIIEGRRRSSQYKIDFVVNVGNDCNISNIFFVHNYSYSYFTITVYIFHKVLNLHLHCMLRTIQLQPIY